MNPSKYHSDLRSQRLIATLRRVYTLRSSSLRNDSLQIFTAFYSQFFLMPPYENFTDYALIDAINQGDTSAFEGLYDRYANKVLKRCYFICFNVETARDLMQEVWIKVFLHLHTFKKQSAFSSWLYRLATNHCLNYINSKAHAELSTEDTVSRESSQEDFTAGIDVQHLLKKLSLEDRTILAMKFMGEYTYEEIAVICKIGVSATKMRVSRLITKLRDEVNS